MNMCLHRRLPIIKYSLPLMLLLVLAMACTNKEEQTVTVAAASNTRYVMELLNSELFMPKGYKVNLIFGSSGKLSTQILNKAPFDLFLSADSLCADKIHQAGLSVEKPKLYAKGCLIFISRHQLTGNDFDSVLKSIKDLTLANPEQAPYGKAAIESLESLKRNQDEFNIVYGSNVSETAHFFLTGSDNAFIPASFLSSNDFIKNFESIDTKENLEKHIIFIPENYYQPIEQKMVLMNEKAREIYTIITSDSAKKIWKKNGYFIQGDH
jgi:molybdate transport system substrate-binding protein